MCEVSQREHPYTKSWPEGEADSPRKSPVTYHLEQLGEALRQAQYLYLDRLHLPPNLAAGAPPQPWTDMLKLFGYQVAVSQEKTVAWQADVAYRTLLALTDDVFSDIEMGSKQIKGRYYSVNVSPLAQAEDFNKYRDEFEYIRKFDKDDRPLKTFTILAEQAEGIKRMGILRMDVDNLGTLFRYGLGKKTSIARVASLSFAMKLFFEGWLEQLMAEVDQGDKLLYSIYAGGDDLFIVGAWHKLPSLAQRINADLQRYTGNHPDIHLSGGIALVPPKYPLYKAAEDAAVAEGAAKSGGKNALTFLGQVIPWEQYQAYADDQQKLYGWVKHGTYPAALLHLLMQLYDLYTEAAKAQAEAGREQSKETIYWGKWHWQSVYRLTRLARRHSPPSNEIDELRDQLSMQNFSYIKQLGLAARWAELLLRKKGV